MGYLPDRFSNTLLNATGDLRLNLISGVDQLLNALSQPWLYHPEPEREENIELVKEYFGYNNVKAMEALRILRESDLEQMKLSKYLLIDSLNSKLVKA